MTECSRTKTQIYQFFRDDHWIHRHVITQTLYKEGSPYVIKVSENEYEVESPLPNLYKKSPKPSGTPKGFGTSVTGEYHKKTIKVLSKI